MKKKNKALSAGIGYTIGNILIKGINFLSVPLFSRILTTEEFGIYNIFIAYDAIICIIISFALYMSLRSAKIEFNEKIDEYTSSITIIYFIISGFFVLNIIFFGKYLSKIFDFSKIILILLIIYSFGSGIITLYNQRIGLEYNYKKYLFISFINSLGNIGVSLILILTIFKSDKGFGRILGVTIVIFCISVYLLHELYKKAKPKVQREYWLFGLKYSLPIVPHGISQVLLSQFDRIMIRNIVGNAAAGIYSLAGNIKLVLTIITDSICTAWQTWFYEQIIQGNIKDIQKRAIQLVSLFSIFCIGLMAISPELVLFLGGKDYISGKYVAIPMIMDAFILFIYNVIVPAEYYTKKTIYIMLGTLFSAVLNIIMNYIFISKYGFIAAAYTTLFSYFVYLILHVIIAKRLIGFNVVPLKKMIELCFYVFINASIDLLIANNIVIRYFVCFMMIVPFILIIIKKYGASKVLKFKLKGDL